MSKIFKPFNAVYEPPKPQDSPLQVSVELLKKLGYSEEGKLILPFKELFPEREKVSIGEILVSEMGAARKDFLTLSLICSYTMKMLQRRISSTE